jgi:hypothetical protein
MSTRIIRYRKPDWQNWCTMTVSIFEYAVKVKLLKDLGYEVEGE